VASTTSFELPMMLSLLRMIWSFHSADVAA